MSCFFTGRADWGLFASVFPCLWGEVAQKLTDEDDRAQALALVKSNDFLQVVQRFRQSEGIPLPSCGRLQSRGRREEEPIETCHGVAACIDAAAETPEACASRIAEALETCIRVTACLDAAEEGSA